MIKLKDEGRIVKALESLADNGFTAQNITQIAVSLGRLVDQQKRQSVALERIAGALEGNGRMSDAELREIMGHTDASIVDALREQWRGDIPDEPIGVTCGICNTTREDDDAARSCAMSHVQASTDACPCWTDPGYARESRYCDACAEV